MPEGNKYTSKLSNDPDIIIKIANKLDRKNKIKNRI